MSVGRDPGIEIVSETSSDKAVPPASNDSSLIRLEKERLLYADRQRDRDFKSDSTLAIIVWSTLTLLIVATGTAAATTANPEVRSVFSNAFQMLIGAFAGVFSSLYLRR